MIDLKTLQRIQALINERGDWIDKYLKSKDDTTGYLQASFGSRYIEKDSPLMKKIRTHVVAYISCRINAIDDELRALGFDVDSFGETLK